MTKQGRPLPARQREAVDDSMLIRSAETLGRMIGSLHRQLDGATKRLSGSMGDAQRVPVDSNGHRVKTKRAKNNSRTASRVVKSQSTADRTAKRASKSASAKKSAARSGSRKRAASRSRQ
jgi:hypothetical protein